MRNRREFVEGGFVVRGGNLASLVIILWGVVAGVSIVQHATRDFLPPETEMSRGQAGEASGVRLITGVVKSVHGTRLALEVRRSPVLQEVGITSNDYVFEVAGATIKIDGREEAPSMLRSGDAVSVPYTELDRRLVARTVLSTRIPAVR